MSKDLAAYTSEDIALQFDSRHLLVDRSDAAAIIAGKDAEIVRLTKENKALAEPPSRSDRVRALLYGRKIDELQVTIAQQADLLEKQQRDALVMVQHNQQAERIAELDAANERHRELARISRDAELSAVRIAAAQSAALAKAREALERLGAHDQNCGVFDLDDDDRHKPCTCGFTEALAALKP